VALALDSRPDKRHTNTQNSTQPFIAAVNSTVHDANAAIIIYSKNDTNVERHDMRVPRTKTTTTHRATGHLPPQHEWTHQ
jgi:hypothetical protein